MHLIEKFGPLVLAEQLDRFKERGVCTFPTTGEMLQEPIRGEVWGTSFQDPGEEFTELRCFAANDVLVGVYRWEGY